VTARKSINKTFLFKGLEEELHTSGNSGQGLRAQLDETVADLHRYFENPTMLIQALNIGALTYEHAFLKASTDREYVPELVSTILAELRQARDQDPVGFFQFWCDQMHSTGRAINNMASVATLQGNKSDLDFSFLVKSYFRDVGDLLEGSLQPMIRLRLEVWEHLGRRGVLPSPVSALTFGKVTEELLAATDLGKVYRPLPFSLSVSQWRNIANHNSYEVVGTLVSCTYGTSNRPKNISLTIDDLTKVVSECNAIYYAHKIAVEFFGIDNAKELIKREPKVSVSEYSQDTSLVYGLVSEGFSIVHAEREPNKWSLILVDKQCRSKPDAKIALQTACYSYLLFVSPIEFLIAVRSGTKEYKFGFIGSLASNSQPTP